MRRDYLTVRVDTGGDEPGSDRPPVLRIDLDCSAGAVPPEVRDIERSSLSGEEFDLALRRDETDEGVLSVARRLTGEFLLEANVSVATIEDLVGAALDRPGEARYQVSVAGADLEPFAFEKRTLLVYDADGNLLRDASLIPSGVEL
ncbi:MAG: DUF5793 family protein [Haloarculaceae archaeon]